jgi:hypothetical protein
MRESIKLEIMRDSMCLLPPIFREHKRMAHVPCTKATMRVLVVSLLVLAHIANSTASARADGNQWAVQNQQQDQAPTTRQNDPRLPAVIPGEQIVTQSGQRMNVWSSAGPVPVNPTQPPQYYGGGGYGYGPGVIVDGRNYPNPPLGPRGGGGVERFGGR